MGVTHAPAEQTLPLVHWALSVQVCRQAVGPHWYLPQDPGVPAGRQVPAPSQVGGGVAVALVQVPAPQAVAAATLVQVPGVAARLQA